MGSVKDWAKNLKYNEETAKKYKGVKTVKDILKLAKSDGYNFTEKELLNFSLDSVAGGSDNFWSLFHFGDNTTTVNEKTNRNEVNTTQGVNVSGNGNYVSMSANSNSNQS